MTDDIDGQLDSTTIVGRRLGRYTCVRQLGSGGMADVYLARRMGAKGFSKVFALKRIKPKYVGDPDFTRMFMREAKLSATLDHPNIAQVVDFGQDGRELFLVMEYVHGPDLRKLLRSSHEGRLPLECSIAVLTRLCAGLHYAHQKAGPDGAPLGLVHRDVSANNVLVSMDGAVKLTDFGIAKGFAQGATGSASSMLVGKPGYMSPEQVRCESLDRRSDVFCLGILLYEATTGHRCFYGDSVFATLNATQRAKFEPPSTYLADYPEALAQIVARALQADPEQRFESARALQSALEEFALDHRIRASDAVLCDYLASLELSLEDPASPSPGQDPSYTEVRETGGTTFMLSEGAPAVTMRAPPPVAVAGFPEEAPAQRARTRAGWWVGGAVVLVGAGLGILGAMSEESPTPTSENAPVTQHADEDGPEESVVEPERPRQTPPADTSSAPASAPPEAAESSPAEAEAPPARKSRPRKSTKRRRPRKTTNSAGDLDVLAPPSRRRQ